jgi:hypothetical protein
VLNSIVDMYINLYFDFEREREAIKVISLFTEKPFLSLNVL